MSLFFPVSSNRDPSSAAATAGGGGGAAAAADEEEEEDDKGARGTWGDAWSLRKGSALALDHMASVYREEILPFVLPLIEQGLQQQQRQQQQQQQQQQEDAWLRQEAAVLALGAVAQGCQESLAPHLRNVLLFLLQLCTHPKPLLRSISCWCISRYASWLCQTEHEHQQQQQQHQQQQHQQQQQQQQESLLSPVLQQLMQRLLDRNKRVQEAACSAFASIEDDARYLLVPFLPEILITFRRALDFYQVSPLLLLLLLLVDHSHRDTPVVHAKNQLILYDAIGTLAEGVGSAFCCPQGFDLVDALLQRWAAATPGQPQCLAVSEALGCIASAMQGAAAAALTVAAFAAASQLLLLLLLQCCCPFSPYAAVTMDRCLQLITEIVQQIEAQERGEASCWPDRDSLECCLDLLSGLAAAAAAGALLPRHESSRPAVRLGPRRRSLQALQQPAEAPRAVSSCKPPAAAAPAAGSSSGQHQLSPPPLLSPSLSLNLSVVGLIRRLLLSLPLPLSFLCLLLLLRNRQQQPLNQPQQRQQQQQEIIMMSISSSSGPSAYNSKLALQQHLLHGAISVANNAGWALGELAVRVGPETIDPHAEALASELIRLLQRPEMHRALLQNVSITIWSNGCCSAVVLLLLMGAVIVLLLVEVMLLSLIVLLLVALLLLLGRLALACPNRLSRLLPQFLARWCCIMRAARNDADKASAFQVLLLLLLALFAAFAASPVLAAGPVLAALDPDASAAADLGAAARAAGVLAALLVAAAVSAGASAAALLAAASTLASAAAVAALTLSNSNRERLRSICTPSAAGAAPLLPLQLQQQLTERFGLSLET
ncbi:hypothetical protein ACSSS7_004239 [Eimeria intestinalis]